MKVEEAQKSYTDIVLVSVKDMQLKVGSANVTAEQDVGNNSFKTRCIVSEAIVVQFRVREI